MVTGRCRSRPHRSSAVRASACASAGPDRRPSRPIQTARLPRACASEPRRLRSLDLDIEGAVDDTANVVGLKDLGRGRFIQARIAKVHRERITHGQTALARPPVAAADMLLEADHAPGHQSSCPKQPRGESDVASAVRKPRCTLADT